MTIIATTIAITPTITTTIIMYKQRNVINQLTTGQTSPPVEFVTFVRKFPVNVEKVHSVASSSVSTTLVHLDMTL